MNNPRFNFFTTPLNGIDQLTIEKNLFNKSRGIYKPPQHECDIIIALQEAGYAPTVNCTSEYIHQKVNAISGLVVVENYPGVYCIINQKNYVFGRVFCLIWFKDFVSDANLGVVKEVFGSFFGLNFVNRLITRSNQILIDTGCLDPPKQGIQIGGSETFSGNMIIKEPEDKMLF